MEVAFKFLFFLGVFAVLGALAFSIVWIIKRLSTMDLRRLAKNIGGELSEAFFSEKYVKLEHEGAVARIFLAPRMKYSPRTLTIELPTKVGFKIYIQNKEKISTKLGNLLWGNETLLTFAIYIIRKLTLTSLPCESLDIEELDIDIFTDNFMSATSFISGQQQKDAISVFFDEEFTQIIIKKKYVRAVKVGYLDEDLSRNNIFNYIDTLRKFLSGAS